MELAEENTFARRTCGSVLRWRWACGRIVLAGALGLVAESSFLWAQAAGGFAGAAEPSTEAAGEWRAAPADPSPESGFGPADGADAEVGLLAGEELEASDATAATSGGGSAGGGGVGLPPTQSPAASGGTGPAQPNSGASGQYVRAQDSRMPQGGQVWREYDLRPYLRRVQGLENPQQPLVDWILRETGTDRWFGSTAGLLSVEQDKLRVYHVPEVQAIVAGVVDRYVHPDLPGYAVSARLVTVESVNWRAAALPMLEPVRVETPGVEAWLMSRENLAVLVAQLRQRVDFQEHGSASVEIVHGQSHEIARWLPRSYPQGVQLTPGRYPGYQVQMGQIREGYSLRISPLVASDAQSVEVMVNCQADQIEKFSPLTLDLPVQPGAPTGRVQTEVPQVASWRLNERFRWPLDRVLLVSRGVVAMPGLPGNATIFDRVIPAEAPRADVVLVMDCHRVGNADATAAPLSPQRVSRLNYHGRY